MDKNTDLYNDNEKPTETFIESDDASSKEKAYGGSRPAGTGPAHADIGGAASNKNAILANPLAGIPQETLMADAASFAHSHGLGHLEKVFIKGALVAQDPMSFENIDLLTPEEKEVLRREQTHRWSQPKDLYWYVPNGQSNL